MIGLILYLTCSKILSNEARFSKAQGLQNKMKDLAMKKWFDLKVKEKVSECSSSSCLWAGSPCPDDIFGTHAFQYKFLTLVERIFLHIKHIVLWVQRHVLDMKH